MDRPIKLTLSHRDMVNAVEHYLNTKLFRKTVTVTGLTSGLNAKQREYEITFQEAESTDDPIAHSCYPPSATADHGVPMPWDKNR